MPKGEDKKEKEDEGDDFEQMVDEAREEMKQYSVFWIFVAISTVAAFAEPLIIGLEPLGQGKKIQVIVLAISTALYLILLVTTFLYVKKSSSAVARIRCLFDAEVMFETICLLIGWVFILSRPGIAALRCFRIFRMLWFFELVEHAEEKDPTYKPEEHFVSVSKVCHICVKYLEAIGCELLTAKSKGGIVLVIFYFYITYVFAVIFWMEETNLVTPVDTNPTTGNNTLCDTLTGCYITMLRLTLYDGTGFDFLGEVIASRSGGMSTLLMLYMCFSAMILLNGLIGVFGTAFEIGEDEDEEGDEEGGSEKGDVEARPAGPPVVARPAKVDPGPILAAIERLTEDVTAMQGGMRRQLDALSAAMDALHGSGAGEAAAAAAAPIPAAARLPVPKASAFAAAAAAAQPGVSRSASNRSAATTDSAARASVSANGRGARTRPA